MSVKRSRPPVKGEQRKVRVSKHVGPDYPENEFTNPVDGGMSPEPYGDRDTKTVHSVNPTTFEGGGAGLRKGGYDKLWDGE